MVGIYKITNKINGHCYVGQSNNIQRRWEDHTEAASRPTDRKYNYPLYRAFRKYGFSNFAFEVLEECEQAKLNEREVYWIHELNPEYNQTIGGDTQVVPVKLTYEQVQEIQQILMNDVDGQVSHKELAEKYGVHKDTIRDINVGRTWYNEKLEYPLHYSKYDARKIKKVNYCVDCHKPISRKSTRCIECENKKRLADAVNTRAVSREELKTLIRTMPFTKIGEKFGVTDNAIRKWCKKYGLPHKSSDIKKISDAEWINI